MSALIASVLIMTTSLAGRLDGVPLATPNDAIEAAEVCGAAVASAGDMNQYLVSSGWSLSTAAEALGQKPDFPVDIFVMETNSALIMRFPDEAPDTCIVGGKLADRAGWDSLMQQMEQLGTVLPDTLLPREVRRGAIRFNAALPIIDNEAFGFNILVSRTEG